MTYLAVPISAKDLGGAKRQIKQAIAAGAEMLELRTDYLEELNVELVEKLIAYVKGASGKALPIIVTCRDKKQGGARGYPLSLRVEVLCAALKAGAEYIDYEYENFLLAEYKGRIECALSNSLKGKLILSVHDFKGKFENIVKLYRHIHTVFAAAVAKLVYTAGNINDCFEAFDLLRSTSGERIIFCMGETGLISRIIAKKLGGLVTFGAIDEKSATAPGQLTVGEFKKLYRFDAIDADTQLYGIIASPAGHSLSPAVHNAGFGKIKANKLYLPLHVESGSEEFEKFLHNAVSREWLGFKGFSVTIPHKQNALELARRKKGFVEPLASKIGAVNTLLIKVEGKLALYNTDYAGALDAITSALDIKRKGLKGMTAAVIGAGGVARAIVAGLNDVGAKIKIYNRTVRKAEKLAAEFNCSFAGLNELGGLEAKLLINCTSIGMHPKVKETPVPKKCLNKDMVVFDTVYNPRETLLLKQAKEVGAGTIDGVEMFINQALAQFKLFTGKKGDAKVMRKAVSG